MERIEIKKTNLPECAGGTIIIGKEHLPSIQRVIETGGSVEFIDMKNRKCRVQIREYDVVQYFSLPPNIRKTYPYGGLDEEVILLTYGQEEKKVPPGMVMQKRFDQQSQILFNAPKPTVHREKKTRTTKKEKNVPLYSYFGEENIPPPKGVKTLGEFFNIPTKKLPTERVSKEEKVITPPEERSERRANLQEREIKKRMYLLRKGKRTEKILAYEDQGDYIAVEEEDGRWRKYPKSGGFSVEVVSKEKEPEEKKKETKFAWERQYDEDLKRIDKLDVPDAVKKGLRRMAKNDMKIRELDFEAEAIVKTSPVGQAPPVYHQTLDKILKYQEKNAEIWNDIRDYGIKDGKTLWQLALKRLPVVYVGKEERLDFYVFDILDLLEGKRLRFDREPLFQGFYEAMSEIVNDLGEYYSRLPADRKNKKAAGLVMDAIVDLRSDKGEDALDKLNKALDIVNDRAMRYAAHQGKYAGGGPKQIKPAPANNRTAHTIWDIAMAIKTKLPEEEPEEKEVEEEPIRFKQRLEYHPNSFLGYQESYILNLVANHIQERLKEYDVGPKDVNNIRLMIGGSRLYGNQREDSDIDVIMQYSGDEKDWELQAILNQPGMYMDDVPVDITPIRTDKSGTLEDWIEGEKKWNKPNTPKEEIQAGDKIEGTFYRGESLTDEFKVPGRTAADVVNYEKDVLGNEDTAEAFEIAQRNGIYLEDLSASRLLWVSDKKEVAERYGPVKEITLPKGTLVLATDEENGYLVLLPYQSKEEKHTSEYVIYHGITLDDLKKIADMKGKLIAPSIGITKIPYQAINYGDIVLIGDKNLLRHFTIYDRDIYSPTLRELPKKLYKYAPDKYVKEIEKEIPQLESILEDNRCMNDPYRQASLIIDSDYDIYRTLERLAPKYLPRIYDKSLDELEKMAEKEGMELEGMLSEYILHHAYEVVANTEKIKEEDTGAITTWMEDCLSHVSEATGFTPLWATIPKVVKPSQLDTMAKEWLRETLIPENQKPISDNQWEVLHLAQQLDPTRFNYSADTEALLSEALNPPTFEHFISTLKEYDIDVEVADGRLKEEGLTEGLEELYHMLLKNFYNIRTDYFEGKTFDVLSINDFPIIMIPEKETTVKDENGYTHRTSGSPDAALTLLMMLKYTGRVVRYDYAKVFHMQTSADMPEFKAMLKAPEEEVIPVKNYTLREEQEEAVKIALQHIKGMLVAPTGTGKTVIFVEIMKRLRMPRTLIVVPTKALMDDLYRRLTEEHGIPKDKIGKYYSEQKVLKHITITTYASAALKPENLKEFDLIIFDEVHHLLGEKRAPTIIGTLQHRIERKENIRVYGFTATPPIKGKQTLLDEFLPIIFSLGIKEMVQKGRMAKSEMFIVPAPLNAEDKKNYDSYTKTIQKKFRSLGTTDLKRIARLMGRSDSIGQDARTLMYIINKRKELVSSAPEKFKKLSKVMEKITKEYDGPIMFFTDRVATLEKAKRDMNIDGISCEIVTGKTPKSKRPRILTDWKNGAFRVIGSINTLTEGIDVPSTKVGVFMGGAGGKIKVIQKIGRLLRPRDDEVARVYIIYVPDTIEERYLNLFEEALDVPMEVLDV